MTQAPPLREDDLIDAIRAVVERGSSRVCVGIGDDAAVWQPSRSHRSVITTDALIEDVHFSRAWMTWREIGARAMAANLSDVAAMGARPVLATIALGIAPGPSFDDVLELYAGLTETASAANCTIVGGDLTRAPALTLAITLVGDVRATHLKLRSGAKPGDVFACTGPLGASRAGLQSLRGELTLDEALREEALQAYRSPRARLREGVWLGASANVHAMMDVSDGLSTDLHRMCERSGVGALVSDVPVAASAAAAARALGEDARQYALAGGEDFELLVAIAPRAFAHVASRFRTHFGRALACVGVAREDRAVRLVIDGVERELARTGWDHFAS